MTTQAPTDAWVLGSNPSPTSGTGSGLTSPSQFSHLSNGDKNGTHLLGLWWGYNDLLLV